MAPRRTRVARVRACAPRRLMKAIGVRISTPAVPRGRGPRRCIWRLTNPPTVKDGTPPRRAFVFLFLIRIHARGLVITCIAAAGVSLRQRHATAACVSVCGPASRLNRTVCSLCTDVREGWLPSSPRPASGFISSSSVTRQQGLTLVHFSAQLERSVWDRGCAQGLCSPCQGGVRRCLGCVGCFLVSDTAQVELRSGRVYRVSPCPPAARAHDGLHLPRGFLQQRARLGVLSAAQRLDLPHPARVGALRGLRPARRHSHGVAGRTGLSEGCERAEGN